MRQPLLPIVIAVVAVAALAGIVSLHDSESSEAAGLNAIQTFEAKEGVSSGVAIYTVGAGYLPYAYVQSGTGTMPPGLSVNIVGATARIMGTPTAAGVYTFVLHVIETDSQGFIVGGEDIYQVTIIVKEKVTYHNIGGSTSVDHYSPYYPHYAPSGSAAAGQQWCGWNTASDGSGTTYLQNSVVPPGIKDLYAQQSASPVTLTLKHGNGGSTLTRSVISGQDVMLPVNSSASASISSNIQAEIGFNTASDGSGIFYPNNEPVQFSSSVSLFGQLATKDPSRTVVVTGSAAYYVPRGETFFFSFTGVPNMNVSFAPIITGRTEAVHSNYPMIADSDTILITQTNAVFPTSVRYNANGGSGSMMMDVAAVNASTKQLYTTKASPSSFTPPAGKMFKQWHFGSVSGPSLSPGETINASGNVELYAEWMEIPPNPVWIITYNANGGTGTITPGTTDQGQPYTITNELFNAPNQRSFVGWGLMGSDTVYDSGDTFTPTGDTTLMAIWQWDFFYINLVPNGAPGSMISLQSPGDQSYIMPVSPFDWTDHVFSGWRVDNSEPTLAVGYELWLSGNVNLYAQWIDTSVPPGPDDPNEDELKLSAEWIAIILLIIIVALMFLWVVSRDG